MLTIVNNRAFKFSFFPTTETLLLSRHKHPVELWDGDVFLVLVLKIIKKVLLFIFSTLKSPYSCQKENFKHI